MRLSDLKLGDRFKFVPGQVMRYTLPNGSHQDQDVLDFLEYDVIKVNPKSVVFKQIGGRLDWTVKFDGVHKNYVNVINNEIIILKT